MDGHKLFVHTFHSGQFSHCIFPNGETWFSVWGIRDKTKVQKPRQKLKKTCTTCIGNKGVLDRGTLNINGLKEAFQTQNEGGGRGSNIDSLI